MTVTDDSNKAPAKRDAKRSQRAILDAAVTEFAEHGHAGARIDAIADRAGVSKPMIYSYFGDKDELYAAALREAYVQIRAGEQELSLEDMPPEQALRALISFTLSHFRSKPWFISMLNTENLRGGTTIRKIRDVNEIQSHLITKLGRILDRGAEAGLFRKAVDPVDLYIKIAALCYFPISNAHTLRAVFKCPVDDAWLDDHDANVQEMVLCFLAVRK